ncbi:hypothetical protein BH10PLA2_BH10PLA2_38090 [soil metagenome]
MADMNLPASWADEPMLVDYLAEQLIRGRLGLFLGAGVSAFYGLPDWQQLLQKLLTRHGEAAPVPGSDLVAKGAYLRAKYYSGKDDQFKKDLREALYDSAPVDFAKLRQNETLAAIGSLVMASKRGHAAKVITLNYDNLLENYLQFHGFTTATVASERFWAQDEDVVIFHPHGFLPQGSGRASENVVLGSSDYHEIMQSKGWRTMLDSALRTHTFLYIGLSGVDMHLQSLWSDLSKQHAIADERTRYHGVRFALATGTDELGLVLEPKGIVTHSLASYGALSELLFRICQVARDKRMRH